MRFIGKVTDLIQKKRSPVGGTEQACLVTIRTGKRSFPVTEKLRGGKLIGNGSAINCKISLVFPVALGMYLVGDMLLSGTGSSTKEYGYIGESYHAYLPVHFSGFLAFSTIKISHLAFLVHYSGNKSK